MEIRFNGNGMGEIVEQVIGFLGMIKGINLSESKPVDTLAKVPEEEIKPVLTQEQMEENLANAPEHVEPPQPTLEEVRDVLKQLRDRKGSAAVKELLRAYGAESVPELKPEDYLGARDRALAEV